MLDALARVMHRSWQRLSPAMKKRLTVENDDRASMFAVSDLLWLHEKVGIPIVFDFHVRPPTNPTPLFHVSYKF